MYIRKNVLRNYFSNYHRFHIKEVPYVHDARNHFEISEKELTHH